MSEIECSHPAANLEHPCDVLNADELDEPETMSPGVRLIVRSSGTNLCHSENPFAYGLISIIESVYLTDTQ